MTVWGGRDSFEERLATVGLGVLAALFAAGVLVWVDAELSGWLTHHAWPPLSVGDAPGLVVGLLQHPADPATGWPSAARRLAPPAWLFDGLLVVFLGVVLAAVMAIAARTFGSSPEHRAARRLPPGLGLGRSARRGRRPFLGWAGVGPLSRMLAASEEDCVAVIGPPRVGKTQGVLIPEIHLWDGPVVSASTKPDVIEATAAGRRALACEHGGRVMLWSPTLRATPAAEVEQVGWSPLDGCAAAETCERRVRALVGASDAGKGSRHADHWRSNAVRILRGYFHAAALERLGVDAVLGWLARNELREPSIVLGRAGTRVGRVWAEELEGMTKVPAEELGSILSAARTALAALQNGMVLESCDSPAQLDADQLLLTRSTVYLVAPTADQDLLAPLAAALVEHVVQRAYELWGLGQLPARLLLCLDELANIAPLPSLLKILSQGGSQGVNLTWAVQSLAQMRDRYGEQVAEAAFSSSRARLVFGGLTDARDLKAISELAGEHEVPARSHTRGAQIGQQSMTAATVWRPRLPVSAIRGIPAGRAMLLYHASDPALVGVRLAHSTRLWQRLARPSAAGGEGPERRRWGTAIRTAVAGVFSVRRRRG
jgi:type IV secretion system protein VirD4